MEKLRKCNSCGQIKHIERFCRHVKYKTGRTNTCKSCHNIKRTAYRYNVDPEVIKRMILDCRGICPICKQELDSPNIDHCHENGHIRGVICRNCNYGLGNFNDSIFVMTKAAWYIIRDRITQWLKKFPSKMSTFWVTKDAPESSPHPCSSGTD